ncbi:MAG: GAF domain-containing protein, partial [Candidatus Limnocylindria bacterium]
MNVDLSAQLEATRQELREALEQQTALTDVLGVISRSPFDLDPILRAVIQNAVRLSGADSGSLIGIDDGVGASAAAAGMTDEMVASVADFYRSHPLVPGRRSLTGRVLMERRSMQIPDTNADPEFEGPVLRANRSLLGVPLARQGVIVGVIVVRKRTVGGFSVEHVRLVEAFADQAVIAIENVRMFNETKESLEQQRAISEILSAISTGVNDATPVFDAVVQ